MIVLTQQFNEIFDKLNQLYFENKLPRIKYKIANSKCYFGRFIAKNVTKECWISMSSVLINNIQDFEDTLAHEMIHYYIWYFNIRDSNSHGVVFNDFMWKINRQGLHKITVSGKAQNLENKETFDIKHGFLCKFTYKPYHIFVFFINKNKINEYKRHLEVLKRTKRLIEYKYFTSNNEYFKYFSECTKSLRGQYLTLSKLNELGIDYDKPKTTQVIDLDDML